MKYEKLATLSTNVVTAPDLGAFAITFAGQSQPWLDTLSSVMASGNSKKLREVFTRAEELLAPLDDDLIGQLPAGFDPFGWAISLVTDEPFTGDTTNPAVSVPGIVLAQLGIVELLAKQGINITEAVAVTGHSQGVLAAEIVAHPEKAAELVALARLIGVACARGSRVAGFGRAPMMSISGLTVEELEPLLPQGCVIGLKNTQTTSVVIGKQDELDQLAEQLAAQQPKGREVEWTVLPVSGAFHHPALAPAVAWVVERAERIGLDAETADRLARAILVDPSDWSAEVRGLIDLGATTILDLGPNTGVVKLTERNSEGYGVAVIAAATAAGRGVLSESDIEHPTSWLEFAPRLVTGDKPRVETKFTKLTGRSPILLGGMTPTTVDPEIVAAAANAGFWAELAGGGQVTPEIFEANVARLSELLEEGRSAQFNTMFLDPYLWGLHIGSRRLLPRAVAAGRPIDGVTISAGIPEVDEAVELVKQLREGGIPHISFKPGTIAQIESVLEIADTLAQQDTPYPIIMQVEGGRAGGHHSWEDLDDLLINTYAKIRRRDVVLAVGGGIGKPEQARDYLMGTWSTRYGLAPMPVDAVIIGTAAMAAKESTASESVKQMLVDTVGTDNWIPAGSAMDGMASGRSQLGADIHEIDNAAARAGRLLDEVAGDLTKVTERRAEIIEAINATAKPYFGDVSTMTYAEVLNRYLELCAPEGTFLDPTWSTRFVALVDRVEARLNAVDAGTFAALADGDSLRTQPQTEISRLSGLLDLDTQLHPADVTFFISELCRTPGKPVPFVPVIDAEVRRWWRSDSLWQAHDSRYDADQVCIIPGPQAVSGITRANEPVAEILGRFEKATAQALMDTGYLPEVPVDALSRMLAAPVIWWAGRQQSNPALALGAEHEWVCVSGASDVSRSQRLEHPGTGAILETIGADGSNDEVGEDFVWAQLTVPLPDAAGENTKLRIRLCQSAGVGAVPVVKHEDATAAMRELTRIAAGGELANIVDGVAEWESVWDPMAMADYDAVTIAAAGDESQATVPDALVGHAWPAIFAAVAQARTETGIDVVEGMLALVHLEHHIRMIGALPQETTTLRISARVDEVVDTDLGRLVVVRAEVRDGGTLLATLSERFAIRGRNGGETARTNTVPFPTVTDTPRSFRGALTVEAPKAMEPFSYVTGDRNPIHVDSRAAALAGLPGVIVHGMWLSAMAEHAAVATSDAGIGNRVIEFTATMLSPVLPGQQVKFSVERRGFDDRPGAGEVREVTATVDGELVLTATAVIAAPTTAYVFPGQGIQSQGMGLSARTRSVAARRVWDQADAMTREKLGFSVLAIVRDNPVEVVVDGVRYFHPEGVLNLTQFTQVAMATLGLAQVAELREAGLLDETAHFAGHSVGEYNALAAFAGALDADAVLEVVYRRGLTMHELVERDEQGRSNYGLCALRPDKIGVGEDEVTEFVNRLSQETGEFLEVVNLNLAGKQYAVAGTVAGLAALAEQCERRSSDGKGFVRIPGIDVPFHSSVLRDGVDSFRKHLERLLPAEITPERLVGRYIPNLTATSFELTEKFVRQMAAVVDSDVLENILADFDSAAENPARLARMLLVELLAWQFCSPVRWIETQDLLLEDLGVSRIIEVGVGTAPTLANLAARTCQLPRHRSRDIRVLNLERDADAVFMRDQIQPEKSEPESEVTTEQDAAQALSGESGAAGETGEAGAAAAAEPTVSADQSAATEQATTITSSATPAAEVADISVSPAEALEVLICQWTKVRPDQLGAADSIETLVDGVSSRRNQLLLDLGVEFDLGSIEGAADAELADLKDKIDSLASGYSAFGPILSEAIADGIRRITGPAGAGANYIDDYVLGEWQLGKGWATAVSAEVMLGTREGASLRGGNLAHLAPAAPTSTAELNQLIDEAILAVATQRGVAVAKPSAGDSGAGVVDSAALTEFVDKLTGQRGILATAARTILEQLGHEITDAIDFDAEDADSNLVNLVTAELGADWPKLVTPTFTPTKAVLLDDRWATSRDDLARLWAAADEDVAGIAPGSIHETAVEQAQWWAAKADEAGRTQLASIYRQLADEVITNVDELPMSSDIAVVTGASPNSIGSAVTAQLLSQGATVVVTTSRLGRERLSFYKQLYRVNAQGEAKLWVVPANLSSFQDLDSLIDWIGTEQTTTIGAEVVVTKPALSPTLLFPFAAPTVSGSLADAGPASETQMRLLLWSVERLIAGMSALGGDNNLQHRLHVVLPGSPNRGRFGGDGAYGEAKAALDAVVARWNVEDAWRRRTTLAHAQIGWVRGTNLMGGNDPLVAAVEAKGVRTFSTEEMAAELIELASSETRKNAQTRPIQADLTGGLGDVDLNIAQLAQEAAQAAGLSAQNSEVASGARSQEPSSSRVLSGLPSPRRPISQTTPTFGDIAAAPEDMVVIVGAGELGPYGSSRTRFEAEVDDISAAGIVELAWSMGLISYEGGWRDADGQPLAESDIASRYRDEVLARVGVRRYADDGDLVDNTMTELTTVYLDRALSFAVRDRAAAETFVSSNPDNTTASFDAETGQWLVTRAAGTPVQVPRRMAMSRYAGGQIPQGFDPARYGIPADMMDNLDRVSLWNIVCTVDAFLSSGFSPAQLLEAVNPARVSSTQGTGIGAMESLRSLYIDGLLGQPRANDVLQEALPNVIAAHVMQSYVGGYGQMIHPVAACATAAVSVEEGVDKIALGKADFVVAGGFDDLSTEGITGFGDMAATADSATMEDKGIDHAYFSRPNDRRRGGFVESQGGGTVLLARGDIARDMGLPVLGVVAYAQSFADGAHTSIPAPGLGALAAAQGGEKSRLARALASLDVTADQVAVLSKHDTSTNANDPNESELHERIADELGRERSNPLLVVSQKSLTGHAKGGAAAFQIIGLTQVLRSGIVPGNRSLDCVDPALAEHSRLVWPTKAVNFGNTLPLKAGFVTSLGFGHVSALVAVVHPEAFYQAIVQHDGAEAAERWRSAAHNREAAGLRRIDEAIYGGEALYERPRERNLADGGRFGSPAALEKAVLLSDGARLIDGVLQP